MGMALAVVLLAGCSSDPPIAAPTPMATATSTPTADPRGPDRVSTIAYGADPNQVGDLRLPERRGSAPQVVVLLHGGFWQEPFKRDLMDGLARDLTARGYTTWNLEYRRVGASGGWPKTALDVAAGIDHLAEMGRRSRVIVIGHSAGGHLALWAAARHLLPEGAPGANPKIIPVAVVSLAGVTDLRLADQQSLGAGSVARFLGFDADREALYPVASPIELLPLGIPQLLVHGTADPIVPVEQSRRYVEAAREAEDQAFLLLRGVEHFGVIDATSGVWEDTVRLMRAMLP